MNLRTPARIYLLAGACSVVLAAVVVILSTRTVHADARLRTAPAPPAASLVQSATPESLASQSAIPAKGHKLRGFASWYGGIFNGRKTASGERFDMNAMTACHPTLPFGSIVRVINPKSHRAVVVRITDRGDLLDGRIIDLSYGAAKRLAMVETGVAPVELQVLRLGNKEP